jgi:hypothetical protein
MKIKTVLLKIGEKNLNERIYTEEAVNEMVNQFMEKRNTNGVFFGQMGFPEDMEVNLSKVSHNVERIWVENNTLYGEINILDTPKGKELKNIMSEIDNSIVFRSRSIGTVNEDGTVNIQKIISFDAIPKDQDSFKDIL